jgi:hypothetical protein
LSKPSEVLNCLIVDFELHGGVAVAQTMLIDSKDLVIVGEGEIDLDAETLDLRLIPSPRGASIFSTAATVQVSGALTDPSVHIEKGSLVTSTTEAIVKRVASVSGVRWLWRKVWGDTSEGSLCATLESQAHAEK